jgi:polyhydroxyalkanoate synthesis regulator phasin
MAEFAAALAELGGRLDASAGRAAEVEQAQNEIRRTLDLLTQSPAGSPGGAPDSRVETLSSRLDELRVSVASLSGSEGIVNELRKAQAALSSALGAICSDLAQLKMAAAEAPSRLDRLAREVADLRGAELGSLRDRWTELAGLVEEVRREARAGSAAAPLPSAGTPPRADLEALQQSLQAVTVRYSEIGELKRSQLAAAASIESLEREIATLREASQKGSLSRVEDLEREVGALKAEVRRILSAGS